jgi:serine phosphatase RsbU (regulator of sigma subunit)
MTELFIYPKTGNAFVLPLEQKKVTLGRASTCDISLSDQYSSGCHAAIIPTEHGYAVQDLGSKNGTFVNGRRISGEAGLNQGDEILVGETKIVFDRAFRTPVEIVEGTTFTHSSNTIIDVRDIVKKPTVAGRADAEKFRQEPKFLAVLSEVSQALIYHMPLDKLLDHIMDLITGNIPMDRGVLMLREGRPDQLVHKVVRVLDSPLRNQSIQVSRSILQTALDKNSSILISDIQSDEKLRRQASIVGGQIRSAMCVPLWNGDEIIGLIYCDRVGLLEQFTEDDLRLLTLLANLAANKIENAKLEEQRLEKVRMEQEMKMAIDIQKNFLPKSDPVFEPFDISGSTRACYHVGGDYYDFIPIDTARLGVVVADVSGTGVSAALLMASLRAALHAELPVIKDLALLAAELNEFVHRSSDSRSFISFFFGLLDRDRGEVLYVNAGHNPPMLVDAAGGVRSLDSTGFCLGMFPSVSYETRTVRLEPGDILCLYTDGITESRNKDKEEFGDERLARRLRDSAGLPARDIMEKIYEDAFAFSACAEPGDDMTLVVLKRSAGGPEAKDDP